MDPKLVLVIFLVLFIKLNEAKPKKAENPRIIIVGAGASGISAYTQLLRNGFKDVIVLEASGRIGGRVQDGVVSNNHHVNLGAQFVEGGEQNPVYELAKKYLKKGENKKANLLYYKNNGNLSEEYNAEVKFVENLINTPVEESYPNDKSYGEYYMKKLEENLKKTENQKLNRTIVKMLFDWQEKYQNYFASSDSWFDIAIGHHSGSKSLGNDYYYFENKPYSTIFEMLLSNTPGEKVMDNILLNKEVIEINWDIDREHEDYDFQKLSIVKCKDGSSYHADHIIVTVSFGVLKSNLIRFVPRLPHDKKLAVEGTDFGTIDRIIMEFPETWWPENNFEVGFVFTDDDKKNILAQFKDSKYENEWLFDLFLLSDVKGDKNLLEWSIFGKSARKMETLPENTVKEKLKVLLKYYFGNTWNGKEIGEPSAIVYSRWNTNPYVKGSNSRRTPMTEKLDINPDEFNKPVDSYKQLAALMMAGEATHQYHGTVFGALLSGYREADRLINLYKN